MKLKPATPTAMKATIWEDEGCCVGEFILRR